MHRPQAEHLELISGAHRSLELRLDRFRRRLEPTALQRLPRLRFAPAELLQEQFALD